MTNLFLNRLLRAIKIDIELCMKKWKKIKMQLFKQAIVVVLSSLAAGVGAQYI